MRKFMKYEIKGSYKFILGSFLIMTILNVFNFRYAAKLGNRGDYSIVGSVLLAISFLIIFGITIALFFYIVNSFRKELYEDRGYLTFTLPITSRKILASKVLVAAMWFVAIFIGFILSNFISVLIAFPSGIPELIDGFPAFINEARYLISTLNFNLLSTIVFTALYIFFNLILILLMIYFSMTLGRVSIKNKKFKGIWFFIFIFVSIIIALFLDKITMAFPNYYLNISNLGIEYFNSGYFAERTFNAHNDLTMNLGFLVGNIISIIALFFGTSYLMENHIDV